MLFYSKTTTGFYEDSINGLIPADAVEISSDDHALLLAGQAAGKVISSDENGYPVLKEMPALTTEQVKAAQWEAIKAERDTRKSAGFALTVNDVTYWFHSDADSRIQYLGLKDRARDLLAAGGALSDTLSILGQPIEWKTMDGSFVAISAQLANDLVSSVGVLDAKLFVVAETHKAYMEASTDPASYDVTDGWPACYGES
jgi:hypothetical protein